MDSETLKKLLIVSFILFFAGCAYNTQFSNYDANGSISYIVDEEVISTDIIRSGDELHIEVWNSDYSKQFEGFPFVLEVPLSGKVFVPYAGIIEVAGRRDSEIEQELESKLKTFLKDPKIAVYHKQLKEVPRHPRDYVLTVRHVTILGMVEHPDIYIYHPGLTVTRLISHAGGVKTFGDTSNIVIIRREGKDIKKLHFDLNRYLQGEGYDDVELLSEDVVYVPPRFMYRVYDIIRTILLPVSAITDAVWVGATVTR